MSADFTPEKEDYGILTPFKMQVLTNFPYIEADFDALTNYGLLCKVVEYLNNVINNENEVTEQVTSLYNAYVSLQNYVNTYFDNLDLTGEVSAKLDEMVEDGTLTTLISGYVDPIYQAYESAINLEVSNFKNSVNESISTQNENITNITNMTQALSYAPIPVSSVGSMTDTSKVYLLTSTGKWYYYNTSTTTWTEGGTYQAAENSEDVNNLINFKNITVLDTYYPTTDEDTTSFSEIDVGHYYDSNGPVSGATFTSYKFIAKQDMYLYFSRYNAQYTAICIYPSGVYPDTDYVRYRNVVGGDQTLPVDEEDKLTIEAGTLVIITINNNNPPHTHFTIQTTGLVTGYYLSPKVIKRDFTVTLNSGNLNINGQGINMNFNNLTFDSQAGLFELQDLSYNGYTIFGTNNDYIGPLRVHGESIIGAKHGEESTTSYKILLDGVELQNDGVYAGDNIDIIVNSTIDTRFTRLSSYAINRESMIANSLITTLAALNIDYIFGSGIISCEDANNINWINKIPLTTDVLIGLNEITTINTKGGTLVSKRLYNNSDYGDHRVAFNLYSGRKKLYYYNTYGSDISVPSGYTFASGSELIFK